MATVTTVVSGADIIGAAAPQRNIFRYPSGRMVTAANHNGTLTFYYSDNGGTSWTAYTGTISGVPTAALSPADEFSIYGTSNNLLICAYTDYAGFATMKAAVGADGATLTWGAAHQFARTTNSYMYGNVVAWYDSANQNTWAAACYFDAESSYLRVEIAYRPDPTGIWVSAGSQVVLNDTTYCAGTLDFHHIGDGLTVQGGTPHIYCVFVTSAGSIYFRKFTYSPGPTWTLGATRSIGTGTADSSQLTYVPSGIFDGTRFCVAWARNAAPYIYMVERDAADTTTTDRSLATFGTAARAASISHDPATDDTIVGALLASDSRTFKTNRYDRSAGSWVGYNTEFTESVDMVSSVGLMPHRYGAPELRGYVSTDSTTDYVKTFVGESFNVAPNAPNWVSPSDGSTQDVGAALLLDWDFSDQDPGDTQSAYTLQKTIGATVTYWNGTGWQASEDATTKIGTATTSHTLTAGWGSDSDIDHTYKVKTWDALDTAGPYSSAIRIVPSTKSNPSIDQPPDLSTITTASFDVTWTVAQQTKYRVKVYADDAGSPGDTVYDSGIIVSTTTTHTTPLADNNTTRHIGVQTWNLEGLASTEDTHQIDVIYDAPPVPTLAVTEDSPTVGAIGVAITNPTPGGGEVDTNHNDLYRRIVGATGDGIRVGTQIEKDGTFVDWAVASGIDYEYRAEAHNDINQTATFSTWTN